MEREDVTVKRKHHTPEQIVRKLAEGEKLLNEGRDMAEVCDHRVDLAPLEEPIRRDEGERRQEAQGARG